MRKLFIKILLLPIGLFIDLCLTRTKKATFVNVVALIGFIFTIYVILVFLFNFLKKVLSC